VFNILLQIMTTALDRWQRSNRGLPQHRNYYDLEHRIAYLQADAMRTLKNLQKQQAGYERPARALQTRIPEPCG